MPELFSFEKTHNPNTAVSSLARSLEMPSATTAAVAASTGTFVDDVSSAVTRANTTLQNNTTPLSLIVATALSVLALQRVPRVLSFVFDRDADPDSGSLRSRLIVRAMGVLKKLPFISQKIQDEKNKMAEKVKNPYPRLRSVRQWLELPDKVRNSS